MASTSLSAGYHRSTQPLINFEHERQSQDDRVVEAPNTAIHPLPTVDPKACARSLQQGGLPADQKLHAEKASDLQDMLGHEIFASKIVQVMIENPEFGTPSTIGIFGPWGSGKSRFINSIKKRCQEKPEEFYVKEPSTKCFCCGKVKIHWCCKLLITVLMTILIGISISSMTYVIYSEVKSSNNTTYDNKTTGPDAQNNTSTESPPTSAESRKPYVLIIAAVVMVCTLLLVLLLPFCHRKALGKLSRKNCKCKAKKTKQKDKTQSNGADNDGIKLHLLEGRTQDITGGQQSPDVEQHSQTPNSDYDAQTCCASYCLDLKAICFMYFFTPPPKLRKKIQVITVDFNAWEYQGCDYLWAGIVTNLGAKVEEYFGKWTVRVCRYVLSRNEPKDSDSADRARAYSYNCCKMKCALHVILITAITVLIMAAVCIALAVNNVNTENISFRHSKASLLLLALPVSAIIAIIRGLWMLPQYLAKSTAGVVQNIRKQRIGKDFKEELGFMHHVKKEVVTIASILHFMSWLYGYQFRVLLIIDDLDRCERKRIMSVLEALTLLLEPSDALKDVKCDTKPSPFVSVLAIDPRVVLGAIESYFDPDNRQDSTHANVNGYEYLKKIIHMPFCLPVPSSREKRDYINLLLNSETPTEAGTSNPAVPQPSQARRDQPHHSDAAQERRQASHHAAPESDPSTDADHLKTIAKGLMQYITRKLNDEQLLYFISGNPRTMKRVCNVMKFALSVYRGSEMDHEAAFRLVLVILMVEQWPFRTCFLRQCYMNLLYELSDHGNTTVVDGLHVLDITHEAKSAIAKLHDVQLIDLWRDEQSKLRRVPQWSKSLALDSDPALFHTFLLTYRLQVKHLQECIPYAVNYDANIEACIRQGLVQIQLGSQEVREQIQLDGQGLSAADGHTHTDEVTTDQTETQ